MASDSESPRRVQARMTLSNGGTAWGGHAPLGLVWFVRQVRLSKFTAFELDAHCNWITVTESSYLPGPARSYTTHVSRVPSYQITAATNMVTAKLVWNSE